MPVRITCPTCNSSYAIDDNLRGKRIVCRQCSKPMQIPGPSAVVKPPQPAQNASQSKPAVNGSKPKPAPAKAVAAPAQKTAPAGERPTARAASAECGSPRQLKKRPAKARGNLPILLFVGGGLAALFVLLIGAIGVVVVLTWKPATQPIPTAHVVKRPELKAPADVNAVEDQPVVQQPPDHPPEAKVTPTPNPKSAPPPPQDPPKSVVEDKPNPPSTGGGGQANGQILALKPYWGARPMTLKTNAKIKRTTPDSPDLDFTMSENVAIAETMVAQRQGLVELRMRCQSYLTSMPQKFVIPNGEGMLNQSVPEIRFIHDDLLIDAKNMVTKNAIDLSMLVTMKAPAKVQTDLTELNNQIQKSLESLSVPLPGRPVQPGETWKAKRPMPIQINELGSSAMIDVIFTFQGVEQHLGRLQGVIAIAGLARDKVSGGTLTGKITGSAYFDLTACQFSEVHVKGDVVVSDGKRGQKAACHWTESWSVCWARNC